MPFGFYNFDLFLFLLVSIGVAKRNHSQWVVKTVNDSTFWLGSLDPKCSYKFKKKIFTVQRNNFKYTYITIIKNQW